MIDLKLFKKLNDNYGHEIGDKCLKTFARYLDTNFKESIIVRLHGDEFSVVTNYDENTIRNTLDIIDQNIALATEQGIIPLKFGFNAGSCPVEKSLKRTKDKSDYMMYNAKQNNNIYQPFISSIYEIKLEKENFINEFDNQLSTENFSYYGRNLYDINDKKTRHIQLYTRDKNGKQLLNGKNYEILRNNSEIAKFDTYNFQKIATEIHNFNKNNTYFVNIDYKSLYSLKALIPFLMYDENVAQNINKINLSIDIDKIESNEYDFVIESINIIRKLLGYKIRLDKYNNKIASYLIEEVNPEYLKIHPSLWKEALNNDKKHLILTKHLELIKAINDNISIIFEQIENKEESNYLKEISAPNTLLSGNFYSKERKLSARNKSNA